MKKRNKFLPIATAVFSKQEEKEIIDTLRSGWITLGPKTKKFEEQLCKFTNAKYAVALNSCSSALHLALFVLGIKKGDEVITTTFTYSATVQAIIHTGAKPILVDIKKDTLNIDEDLIEKHITKNTKAIIPVDYAGSPVNLNKIKKIAKKHNLYIVEDAAHAIGSKYKGKNVGEISDMTCFSFHPVKNMTTGDGGAITTNNKKLYEKLMVARVNGMDKNSWRRNTSTGTWDYEIVSEGYKYHMNDLSASLGIHQLKKLNKFNLKRRKIAEKYNQKLEKIDNIFVPKSNYDKNSSNNLYPILLDVDELKINRNEVINKLKEYNIGSIVYFRPLHLQPYFSDYLKLKKGDFPNSEYVFDRLICLPIYPAMKMSDVNYVTNILNKVINQKL